MSGLLSAIVAILFAGMVTGGQAGYHAHYINGKGDLLSMAEIRDRLVSENTPEREKTELLVKMPVETRKLLLEEVLSDLRKNPERELATWEVGLLLLSGERIRVIRSWPDGRTVTSDELVIMFKDLEFPKTILDVFTEKGITAKSYWVPTPPDFKLKGGGCCG